MREKTREQARAEKDRKDEADVADRSTASTPVIYEVVRRDGEEEMERPNASLWWSGVAAGLSISFSLLAQAVLDLRLPDTQWKPLLVALSGFGQRRDRERAHHAGFDDHLAKPASPADLKRLLGEAGRTQPLYSNET